MKFWATALMLLIMLVLFAVGLVTRCGTKPEVVEVDPGGCDELALGEVVAKPCQATEDGEIVYVCTNDGLKELSKTCKPKPGTGCNKVTFEEDLKPLIQAKCAGCHFSPPYTDYQTAKALLNEMLRRFELGSENRQRMPQPPAPELSPEEKKIFQDWKTDGLIKSEADCVSQELPRHINFDDIETLILSDLAKIESRDRAFTRWLVASHKYDLKESPANMQLFSRSMAKGLNSLVQQDRDLFELTPIDGAKTIWRFDLRTFELDRDDWLQVERLEKLGIISNTDKGNVIKQLTRTNKPWLHFDNFLDTALGRANIYYFFTETPRNFKDFAAKIGLDFTNDINDFRALFAGFNGSPISIQKNRIISQFETDEGSAWVTYDPVDLNGVRQRNAFEFPLVDPNTFGLGKADKAKFFDFFAGEVIYSLPSGLHGYALFNAAGVLQDFAPTFLVVDNHPDNALGEFQIDNPNDCFRCHSKGYIPHQDEILAHYRANSDKFTAEDRVKIEQLYRGNIALNAAFVKDNNQYQAALKKLNIDINGPDPINFSRDRFLLDYTVEEVAALLFLETEEFKIKINQSAQAKAKAGQLLTGGTVTFIQLLDILAIIIADLRLFEEPINGR